MYASSVRICQDIIPLSVDRVQSVRSQRDQRLEGATHTPAKLLRGREAFGKRSAVEDAPRRDPSGSAGTPHCAEERRVSNSRRVGAERG